jgi:type I site-specific restriction endonuclease
MATIAQLAPTLIAVGLSAAELKKELRPHNAPPAILDPVIPIKRYKQAYLLLAKHPEMTNEQIAAKVTTITPAIVATIRAEVEAVIAKLNEIEQYNKKSFKSIEENFNRNKMKVCMTIGILPDGNILSLANTDMDKKILSEKLFSMANQLLIVQPQSN